MKKLRIALAVLVSALLLTACGGSGTAKPTEEQTPPPVPEKVAAPKPYQSVLDQTYFLLTEQETAAIDGWGLSPLLEGHTADEIGFAALDMNGDGTDELLIMNAAEDDFVVYAAYTVTDGEATCFACSDENTTYYILCDEEYMLFADWSYDGGNSGCNISVLNEYGGLTDTDALTVVGGEYHRQATAFDMIPITEEEFTEAWNAYCDLMCYVDTTPMDQYDYTAQLTADDIPVPLTAAMENAGEDDLFAVWVNPSDLLVRKAGGCQIWEESGDVYVFMALRDGVSLKLDHGEPGIVDGSIEAWLTDYTMYETEMDALELLALQILTSEGIPEKCIVYADAEGPCGMWPLEYPGEFGYECDNEGGCLYLSK